VAAVIRNISDTAFLTAAHRALETERRGAIFRDPLARRLAGARGDLIQKAFRSGMRDHWAWAARTYLFDQVILDGVADGADTVINLAAGLDARPYRMALPPSLNWIEVDLPEVIAYKTDVLAGERPACRLERVEADLADRASRRRLFDRIAGSAHRALVVTEGLIIYLSAEEAGTFARDLADTAPFRQWTLDLASPGLLRMMQKRMGSQLATANAALRFAPAEGPAFFEAYGWRPAEVHSLLTSAARVMRLPLMLRLFARLPDRGGPNRLWSAVCVMERRGS
jgi:methyltransferase (TIGR00027 family)